MNKTEFNKWVDKMIQEMAKGRNTERYCYGYRNNTGVFVVGDRRTGKTGMSRKHPDDEFNFNYGLAIAYARCKGYKVPKLTTYKKLSEMEYGDRFFLNACSNEIYAFIGHSFAIDTYIIEKVKDTCLYYLDDDIEYEMVE